MDLGNCKRLFLMISSYWLIMSGFVCTAVILILQIPYYSTIIQRPPRVWKRSLYKSKTQNEVILGCFTKIIRIIFVGYLPLVIFCLIPSLLNVMFGWFSNVLAVALIPVLFDWFMEKTI